MGKGILKNSKTTENLRLYSNPAEDNNVKSTQSDFESGADLIRTEIHEPVTLSDPLSEDNGSHVVFIQAVEPSHPSPLSVVSDRVGNTRLISSSLSSPVSAASSQACPAALVTVCSGSQD